MKDFIKDEDKTKEQLITELKELRSHIKKLSLLEKELSTLQKNETKYRALLDSTVNAIFLIDQKNGQIIDVNNKASHIYGYSREEFITLKDTDLCADSHQIKHCSNQDTPSLFARHHRKKDGSTFPVEIMANTIQLNGQKMIISSVCDLNDAHNAEEALHKSEKRFKAVIDNVLEYIYSVEYDSNGNIVETYHSPQCKDITGYSVDEYQKNTDLWITMVYEKDRPKVRQFIEDLIVNLGSKNIEHRIVHKDSSLRWVSNTCSVQVDYNGNIIRKSGFIVDITKRKNMEEQLKRNAYHDTLTSLPNRKLFIDLLSQAIARAKRDKNYSFAVLFLDLDKFKNINDSFGHIVGDKLLLEISSRLKSAIRENDTVARFAGDEFVVLLDDIQNINAAIHTTNRIQEKLSKALILEKQKFFISVSIGILMYSSKYDSPDDIVRDADTAMYKAKNAGRARYEIFDDKMHDTVVNLLHMENDLRRALENKEFFLSYQPIVSLKEQKIIAVEALLRWNHPQKGIIPPKKFIPLAEDTGAIVPITEWIVKTAIAQLATWRKAGFDLKLALNLSVINLANNNLLNSIQKTLHSYDLSPTFLDLEITENIAMKKFDLAISTLHQLSKMGGNISIDDFGTGYSSLLYLKKFPVNAIKIDKSFVRDIEHNPDMKTIIKAIVVMAHALKIKVIAEGIETEEQLTYLASLNCDAFQGFFFSKPILAEKISSLLYKQLELFQPFLLNLSNKTK